MYSSSKPLNGKRIGLFGKGGCGKSTITILLAKTLRQLGYDVCILDADSTNVGMHLALGISHAPSPLLEYFGGMVFSGGRVTCPVDDPTPLLQAEIALDDLPETYVASSQEGITFLSAGKIGDKGPGAGCDGPISKIARDFRIDGDERDCVTLVDFKAGFEDSARGAITRLDWAVVVVDPTTAALQMAVNMRDLVARINAGELPATAHLESPELVAMANDLFQHAKLCNVYVLLNRVRGESMEAHLRAALEEEGITPIGIIHEQASITQALMVGSPLEVPLAQQEMLEIVARMESIP
jgi:CO dehydrogenase maturation factor